MIHLKLLRLPPPREADSVVKGLGGSVSLCRRVGVAGRRFVPPAGDSRGSVAVVLPNGERCAGGSLYGCSSASAEAELNVV